MPQNKRTRSGARDVPQTTDMIRADIDRGLDGDKINFPDPSAAPLGTDAEAAGATPTREERVMAARQPKAAAYEGEPSPPSGGAVLSWKAGLVIFAFALVVGSLIVSLRIHQLG